MEDLMQFNYKKSLLIVMLALLIPAQMQGFSYRFNQMLSYSFSWVKTNGSSLLDSLYGSSKKCAAVALAGVGFLAAGSILAGYFEDRNERALLSGLISQLDKQRIDKALSYINHSNGLLSKPHFNELNRLIKEYNQSLSAKDIPASLVFDTYEHHTALEKRRALTASGKKLDEARQSLLDDPLCQELVGVEHSPKDTLKSELERFLPFQVLSNSSPRSLFSSQAATIEAQKIEFLEPQINDCKSHIESPMYRTFGLGKKINDYLIELQEHAKAVKTNTEKLNATRAFLSVYGQQFDNKYQEIVVAYDTLRKHIQKLQENLIKSQNRSWRLPTALCAATALAAVIAWTRS
jgi:hypothetical protein